MPSLTFTLQYVSKSLNGISSKAGKRNQRYKDKKGRNNTVTISDDMQLHIENIKEVTKIC